MSQFDIFSFVKTKIAFFWFHKQLRYLVLSQQKFKGFVLILFIFCFYFSLKLIFCFVEILVFEFCHNLSLSFFSQQELNDTPGVL